MERADYFRKLFVAGAIWNWLAALSLTLGYKWYFPLFKMDLPQYPVFLILFLGLAFVFGIGYYWVSRDITKNHGIVKMGIIGKVFVFVVLLSAGMKGQVAWALVGGGAVDLAFAVLFIDFLVSCHKTTARE